MSASREPKQLGGAVFHPGAGYHSYPPAKDRTPRARECPHCELVSATNEPNCPVCGMRFEPRLRDRLMRRFGRA